MGLKKVSQVRRRGLQFRVWRGKLLKINLQGLSLRVWDFGFGFVGPQTAYLEGQGDLVSRLITLITHIVALVIPNINLFTKSPMTLQVGVMFIM